MNEDFIISSVIILVCLVIGAIVGRRADEFERLTNTIYGGIVGLVGGVIFSFIRLWLIL